MKDRLIQIWQNFTIRRKIGTFTYAVFLIILLSVIFDIWIVRFSLVDFNGILLDNGKCNELVSAIEEESKLFEAYNKNGREETEALLMEAIERTEKAVSELPFSFNEIGEQRYAKTWNIRSCYEVYVGKRDSFLDMNEDMPNYITKLYEVYEIQGYLRNYAGTLMDYTLDEGNVEYKKHITGLAGVPLILIVMAVFLLTVIMQLSKVMNRTIIYPITELGKASKRIAANDFFPEDVVVDNKDELGDLVHAFNKMKYATGEYITTLEENKNAMDLLHEQEIAKLETERRLEITRMKLLKSQINPHFLFNTLNVIGGMANLEDAANTERMIKKLSALFRYSLMSQDEEVALTRELKTIADYMYLQEMRFGDRIVYKVDCRVDETLTMVPAFMFQPLVENAIIHGLSSKEEGGCISIKINKCRNMLSMIICDNGVGMTRKELSELRKRLDGEEDTYRGIGLGNIYRRIKICYPGSIFRILSKKDSGTVVRIDILRE